jgi:hypothetical protein
MKDLSGIRPGTRVTYYAPAGKGIDRATGKVVQEWGLRRGKVVLNMGTHLVVNLGGRYGTPGVVFPDKLVHAGARA